MKLAVLGFFALVGLSACGLIPPKPEEVKTADNNGLCYGYGRWMRAGDTASTALIQGELRTRGLSFTLREDAGIMKEQWGVFVGMSECGLIAALGANQFHVNETLTANTTVRQYVVRGAHWRMYVYVRDGKVTTIQQ